MIFFQKLVNGVFRWGVKKEMMKKIRVLCQHCELQREA